MSTEVDVYKKKIGELSVTVLSKISTNKHSFCWNHFGQLVVNIEGKKRTVLNEHVFCDACLKRKKEEDCDLLFSKAHVKSYSKNVATSNLLRHLKDEHNLEEVQQKLKAVPIRDFFSVQRKSTTPVTKSGLGRKDKWMLSRDLALWFARSLLPFDSINDEAMIDFFLKYNVVVADEDIPSRHNIAREGLEDVYNSMLVHVKNVIQKHNVKFGALTTDLWTDQYRRRNYITGTFHFISKEMKLLKFTLATRQVTEKHTGERIKEEIRDMLRLFEIPEKDIVLVTDSGSNMKRAAKLMNIQSHLCLGHALHNLVTVDGIESTHQIYSLITKCKKIVKYIRYRAPQLEVAANDEQRELLSSLETVGEQLEDLDEEGQVLPDNLEYESSMPSTSTNSAMGAPPTIKTSTPTRWHSILMMLSSISHKANRRPVRDMLIDIGRTALLLDENEYNLITSLITFLEKFKTIVDILSSDSQTTINLTLVFKSEIRRLLDECDDNEPALITILKNNMSVKLDYRFPCTDMIIAATLLDCRFQSIKEIDIYMEKHATTKVTFLSTFTKTILKNEDVIQDQITQDATPEPSTSKPFSNFFMDLARTHTTSVYSDIDSTIENECWKYFSTATPADLQAYGDNVLEYWQDRKTSFPWLSSLARAVLFVPATSTPSERVFSVAGQLITAKRSRLNPLRVNRIIFIHDNYSQCKADI